MSTSELKQRGERPVEGCTASVRKSALLATATTVVVLVLAILAVKLLG